MRNRNLLFVIIILAFTFTAISCGAKEQGVVKLGTINLQKVLFESNAGKEAKAAFEKELQSKQFMLQSREKEIKEIEAELAGVAAKNDDGRKIKEERHEDLVKDLKRLRQDFDDELKKKDNDLTSKIIAEVYEISKKLGEEGGYTAIIQETPQFVYIERSIDLTEEVIKLYDKQYSQKK